MRANVKLWSDCRDDQERAEFIESGRAYETGIIAKAVEQDLIRSLRQSHYYEVLRNLKPIGGQNE